jgi:uncharacterized protein
MMALIAEKNIPLAGSEGRLMGVDIFFEASNAPKPVVLYIHGFNGFKDWGNMDLIATQFASKGYVFVKMNLSHNGTTLEHPEEFVDPEAFGQNNYSKELYDVGCVIDWLCMENQPFKEELNNEKLVLLGHSRGGGGAILKASVQKNVKALITWASVAECQTPWGSMSQKRMERWKADGVMYYINKRTGQQLPMYYQLYEDFMLQKDMLSIRNAIQAIRIPILLCHGTKDAAVPIGKALLLKSWQPSATLFQVDSDHVFGRTHPWTAHTLPEAAQTVVDASIHFLNDKLFKS